MHRIYKEIYRMPGIPKCFVIHFVKSVIVINVFYHIWTRFFSEIGKQKMNAEYKITTVWENFTGSQQGIRMSRFYKNHYHSKTLNFLYFYITTIPSSIHWLRQNFWAHSLRLIVEITLEQQIPQNTCPICSLISIPKGFNRILALNSFPKKCMVSYTLYGRLKAKSIRTSLNDTQ